MKTFAIISIYLLFGGLLYGTTIIVPSGQSKIQYAINVASNGDTILVAPGRYFENLNFGKKNLVLTSYYIFDCDTSYISNTIIDGSKPTHPDTASVIIIIGKQDSTTVVQGFTITGGQGTAWKDEHSNGTYREGGGILIALSSPVIQNNLISYNYATNRKGLTGTGGGGIRCGDGAAKILNNVIINNQGRYGGAMVFNWCNATIRNNIIAGNSGGEDYGGGGIWINGSGAGGKPNIIENNTIVGNHCATDGGGILIYNAAAKAIIQNNIIYGNTATRQPQISVRGGSVPVTYCNIQGGWEGEGNIDEFPGFTTTMFVLNTLSPCIDAGNPENEFNDIANSENQNNALHPAMGSLRNDMGAYGGKGACMFPYFNLSGFGVNKLVVLLGNNNLVGVPVSSKIDIINQSTNVHSIDSVKLHSKTSNLQITLVPANTLQPSQADSIVVVWTPNNEQPLSDTLLIYHNATNTDNPIKIALKGEVKKTQIMF